MTDKQKSKLRLVLMVGVPLLALIIGGIIWLTGGRYESTDNAYVKADKIMISPEVSGMIKQRFIDNNQMVVKGAPLLTIDPRPFEIALAKANADLNSVYSTILKKKSEYQQKQEEIDMSESDMALADAQYERTETLSKTGAQSKSQLDEATRNRDSTHAQMALLQRELEGIAAELDGNPDIDPKDHSSYKAALATYEQAQLDLANTKIFAPADGIVGNVPNPGDYARASVPVMSLVATSRVWVEANFKETQIEHIHPGLVVDVEVDTFPDRKFRGTVESISGATGSEFSILPAQNATGNWVKVVQRIAVRIKIEDEDAAQMLRPGMSAEVKVDLQS